MLRRLLLISFFAAIISGCTQTTSSTSTPSVPTTVSVSDSSVLESTGNATITVSLNQAASTFVSLNLAVTDGTALAGVDYALPVSNSVIFQVGQTTQIITIPLINDGILRENKYFNISIQNLSGATLGKSSAIVTIVNTNLNPQLNFANQFVSVAPLTGALSLTLNLTAPTTQVYVVPYTVSGTASSGPSGTDSTFKDGYLTIPIGASSAVIQGSILGSAVNSDGKTIVVTLGSSNLPIGSANQSTVLITNTPNSPFASINGAPSGTSSLRSLNVSVAGFNIVQYKYALTTTQCSSSTSYSAAAIPVSNPISDSLTSYVGSTVYLCVLGSDSSGNWQPLSNPTMTSWTVSSSPLAPTFGSILSPATVQGAGYISNQNRVSLSLNQLQSNETVNLFTDSACSTNIGVNPINSVSSPVYGLLPVDDVYSVYATAVDQYGTSSPCSKILSSYTLDTVIPTVVSVLIPSPTAGQFIYQAGVNFSVVVTFSKNVNVSVFAGKHPSMTMNTTPVAEIADYVTSSGNTITLGFTSSLGSNTNSLGYASSAAMVASGAVIQDLAGNIADLTLPIVNTVSLSPIMIETNPPSPVGLFSNGLYCQSNQTPLFDWVPGADPFGYGIDKYQVAIGSTASLAGSSSPDILIWTDVHTNSFQTNIDLSSYNQKMLYGAIRSIDQAGNISQPSIGLGFLVDGTPPPPPSVNLGLVGEPATTFILDESPLISWGAVVDVGSGLDHYEVSIGSSAGASDVVNWFTVGTSLSTNIPYNGVIGNIYYANVKSVDKVGNFSVGTSNPWQVRKTVFDPVPALVFNDFTNGAQNTVMYSNPQTVSGLDIPCPISVTSAQGNPLISVNGAAPVASTTIKNGDTVQLLMKSSPFAGTTYTANVQFYDVSINWNVSTWNCPANYVYVPGPIGSDFCVSKYQINTQNNSSPPEAPNQVLQPDAIAYCQALNPTGNTFSNYSLISNIQWQTIAKNIESVGTNWSGGTPGNGSMNGGIINTSVYSGLLDPGPDDSNPCFGSNQSCPLGSKYSRISNLTTPNTITGGNVLWDFTGLSWQWVMDTYGYSEFTDSNPNAYECPNSADTNASCFYNLTQISNTFLIYNFGPDSTIPYSIQPNLSNGLDGIGTIVDQYPSLMQTYQIYNPNVYISRGGAQGDENSVKPWIGGVFSARISQEPYMVPQYGYVTRSQAFRTNDFPETCLQIGAPGNPAAYLQLQTYNNNPAQLGITNSSCNSNVSTCTTVNQFGTNCSVGEAYLVVDNSSENTPCIFFGGSSYPSSYYAWDETCYTIDYYYQEPSAFNSSTAQISTPPALDTATTRCVYQVDPSTLNPPNPQTN